MAESISSSRHRVFRLSVEASEDRASTYLTTLPSFGETQVGTIRDLLNFVPSELATGERRAEIIASSQGLRRNSARTLSGRMSHGYWVYFLD